MDTFSAALDEYSTLAKTDPLRTWLIFENTDLANTAIKALQKEGSVLSDHITTVKGIAKTILHTLSPATRNIGPEEQHLLFTHIAAQVWPNRSIPDTLTENLVNLFITQKTHKLILPNGSKKYDELREIFRLYEEFCTTENCCDSILGIEWGAGIAGQIQMGTIICYALYKPTPLAASLLTSLSGTIKTWPPASGDLPALPDTCKEVSLFSDTITELRFTLDSIAALIESGVPPNQIALLTPSLNATLPLLDELVPDFSVLKDGIRRPLLFTAGEDIQIENLPPVRAALAWLSAFAFDCKIEDLKIIIESPYFSLEKNWLTAGRLEKAGIITKTEKGKAAWGKLAEKLAPIRHHDNEKSQDTALQTSLDLLIARLHINQKKFALLRDHCSALKADLSDLGWINRSMKPQDEAARHAFLRLLEKLSLTSCANERYSIREFYAMLCRFSEKTTKISYPESKNAFIAGDLRSVAGTKIPYVFITGLSADRLPMIEGTIPLLNAGETKRIQPDRILDLLDSSRYYFHAAILAAKDQLVLSCAASDGDKNLTPSPYLTRLAEPALKSQTFLSHSLNQNQFLAGEHLAAGKEEACSDLFGTSQLADTAERIGIETIDRIGPVGIYDADFSESELAAQFAETYTKKSEFAPTVLEKYKECPFKWYLSKHLYLEDPADFSAESIIVGTVMHKVMERFFKEYTKPLTEENENEATLFLEKLVTEEFANRGIKTPSWRSKLNGYLGEGGLVNSCQKIIELEMQYYKEGYRTTPLWIEKKVTAEIPGDEPFTVSGWVDRVMINDQTGEFVVIDYKTGVAKKYTDLAAGKALQIPLYTEGVAQTHKGTANPGIYLKIASNEVGIENPYFVRSNQTSSVDDIRDKTFEICKEIRNDMRSGKCSVSSEVKCPDEYCSYRRICRFVPFRIEEEKTEMEEREEQEEEET